MTTGISYGIAVISTVALIALWFLNTYQVISRKRQDMMHAEEQVRLHREGFRQMRGSVDEQSSLRMLETSEKVYMQIEKSYHLTLRKPFYRIPGLLMGFRRAENNREEKKEEEIL